MVFKSGRGWIFITDLCLREDISVGTFYSWHAKFGGIDSTEAQRLRTSVPKIANLKNLLAEAHLDISAGKALPPQAKRADVQRILDADIMSEQRACSLVGYLDRLGAIRRMIMRQQ